MNASWDGDSTTSLGSLRQSITALSENVFFPNIQPPLMQFEAITFFLITVTWENRLTPTFPQPLFPAVVDRFVVMAHESSRSPPSSLWGGPTGQCYVIWRSTASSMRHSCSPGNAHMLRAAAAAVRITPAWAGG